MNKILQGSSLEVLKTLDEKSIDMCMTSPPYWALRDYGVEGQLGLEPTFQQYISDLCDIFDEVKRVLKDEGTIWVNLGDTYYGSKSDSDSVKDTSSIQAGSKGTTIGYRKKGWDRPSRQEFLKAGADGVCLVCGIKVKGKKFCSTKCLNKMGNEFRSQNRLLPDKCLVMIPMRFALEMVNRGWILRNTIIWHKPNCMPSSVKDRFTVDFEYIFFFSKKKIYYFETQYEPSVDPESYRGMRPRKAHTMSKHDLKHYPFAGSINKEGNLKMTGKKYPNRNKRSVWSINPKGFKESHFAVYPEKLCETPIKAGCPEGGIVLDPFFGGGTTGVVALKQGKKFLGIELNPEYIEIANKRLKPFLEQRKLFSSQSGDSPLEVNDGNK